MKKAHLKALEKVYSNEIEQALVLCGSGIFRATVVGWELTHAGRLAYCLTCEESEPLAPSDREGVRG